METEVNKIDKSRKKNFLILICIFAAFIIYYSIMSMLGPGRKLSQLKTELATEQTNNITDLRIFSDSAYLKLLKEKSYLQSRVTMAGTDSIYLTLNLSDSIINIEISGVVVHEARLSRKKVSKMLTKGNENLILSMLATPFIIKNEYSTIKKEPVMIKMAPKDTSEYKPDIMPDTSLTVPVNFIMEMSNGTKIYVYQEEKEKFFSGLKLSLFGLKEKFRVAWSSLKSVVLFKVPEYHPFIKIWVPRSDAKVIYRAIPNNGQVGIYR